VVIPCYNYGWFLPECVASVLAQDGVQVDVTIVDDASTDDSIVVAEKLAAADPRVTVLRHPENRGHIATFNDALAAATADYVVKMDADDALPAGSLSRSVDLLEAHPDVAVVYGYPLTFTTAPPVDVPAAVASWSVWTGEDWIDSRVRRGHNVIMQPEVMMRRSALEEVGGHRDAVPEASDLNLWLRLASAGSVGRVNGPVQGFYRRHPASMQHTIHAGFLSDLNARLKAFELFFEERGNRLTDPAELRRRLLRTLARDAVRLANQAFDRQQQDQEPVAEYREFALRLDPGITRSAGWWELALREAGARTALRSVVCYSPAAAAREVADRVRWRRWRRTGL
jgi:glycosyltransferase involved in cell wall biosynthesis